MFGFGIGRQLTCVFAVLCVLMSRPVAADEADFVTEEFLKKEFTLAKPYRGEWSCQRLGGCRCPARTSEPAVASQTELKLTRITDLRRPCPPTKCPSSFLRKKLIIN